MTTTAWVITVSYAVVVVIGSLLALVVWSSTHRSEVAEGATSIPLDFIVDGRVRGYLVNTSGARVTPVVTAICRIRNSRLSLSQTAHSIFTSEFGRDPTPTRGVS